MFCVGCFSLENLYLIKVSSMMFNVFDVCLIVGYWSSLEFDVF